MRGKKTAQKLPRAMFKVVAQTAEMENGLSGVIGAVVRTLAEVVLAGGRERSKPRRMSVASQQLASRRNTSNAMKQFRVPKTQIVNSVTGVRGVIALALAME